MREIRKCKTCGKEFKTYSSHLKTGRGKYCSYKCRSESPMRKIIGLKERGKNHWRWKGGSIKRNCLICNKVFYVGRSLRTTAGEVGKCCSKKCAGIFHSQRFRGSKHWGWKGGESKQFRERFTERNWKKIRQNVFIKDDYTCQICSIKLKDRNGRNLSVHHIIPFRVSQDDSLENLLTLCSACHRKEEVKYYKTLGTNKSL